jgi:hypothetical protein
MNTYDVNSRRSVALNHNKTADLLSINTKTDKECKSDVTKTRIQVVRGVIGGRQKIGETC